MPSLHSAEESPRARAPARARMNRRRPLGLVELRLGPRRPWWRRPDSVLSAAAGGVVGSALLIFGLAFEGVAVPELHLVQWTFIAVMVAVWRGRRPCSHCGRWTRHALLCLRHR